MALPKGAAFRTQVIETDLGRYKVVRVVTPAWITLPLSDRILKLLKVANKELTEAERKDILRFSVLTPEELDSIYGKVAKNW